MSNFYVVEESRSDFSSCPEQYQVKADDPEDAVRIFIEDRMSVNLRKCEDPGYAGWKSFTVYVNPEPEERNEDWYSLITEY